MLTAVPVAMALEDVWFVRPVSAGCNSFVVGHCVHLVLQVGTNVVPFSNQIHAMIKMYMIRFNRGPPAATIGPKTLFVSGPNA